MSRGTTTNYPFAIKHLIIATCYNVAIIQSTQLQHTAECIGLYV